MRLYIPIAGTWSRRYRTTGVWYRRGSPFDTQLTALGYQRVEQDRDPRTLDRGYWSGDVNGLLIQTLWWRQRKHRAWREGAAELRRLLHARRREFAGGVTVVAHSHGGQVVAYALHTARPEVPISVVTVDMPIRRDMADVYEWAVRWSARWTHLYSGRGWASRWRWLGNRFGARRLAGATNIGIPGGHSGILCDPVLLPQWNTLLPTVVPSRDDPRAG